MNSSAEISLRPIFIFSTDLNNDEVSDVVWGSRGLILAFNGDYPELMWSNTSTISNLENIAIAEISAEPQDLIIANRTSVAYLRLQDGHEWSKISFSPKNILLLAAGFMNSDNTQDILVFTEDGSLICAESDGSLIWNQSSSGAISALTVGDITGNGRDDVVIANETHILALNGSSGDFVGNWSISSSITHIRVNSLSNESLQNGFVALEASGKAMAYLITNSTPVWSAHLNSGSEWLGISEVFSEGADQIYVFATKDGWLFCRDGASGEHIWDRQLPVNVTKNLATADLVGSEAMEVILATQLTRGDRIVNNVIVLNGESGGFHFQADFPAEVILTMSADWNNDTIADLGVATTDGWLYAMDIATGLPIWTANIPILLNLTNDESTSRINRSDFAIKDVLVVSAILISAIVVGLGVMRYFRKK
ncbi:MAG: PQQ-binding-like beta-propeller repeat protein [Candidatus Hodarchaeota archaeon]